MFLDHKGQVFHLDLAQVERLQLLAPSAHAVADNVASPGAPLLLWHVARSRIWVSSAWALHEFLEPDHEDWMVVAKLMRRPDASTPSPPPESLKALAWHTDHLRRRSEGFR